MDTPAPNINPNQAQNLGSAFPSNYKHPLLDDDFPVANGNGQNPSTQADTPPSAEQIPPEVSPPNAGQLSSNNPQNYTGIIQQGFLTPSEQVEKPEEFDPNKREPEENTPAVDTFHEAFAKQKIIPDFSQPDKPQQSTLNNTPGMPSVEQNVTKLQNPVQNEIQKEYQTQVQPQTQTPNQTQPQAQPPIQPQVNRANIPIEQQQPPATNMPLMQKTQQAPENTNSPNYGSSQQSFVSPEKGYFTQAEIQQETPQQQLETPPHHAEYAGIQEFQTQEMQPVSENSVPENLQPVETIKPAETMLPKNYAQPDNQQVQQPQQPINQPVQNNNFQEHVVDMRTNNEPLDSVDPNADPLTKQADKEEEEFIQGVEQAHGRS